MQRINLDTLNVRRLNFTDNTIYRRGRPLYLTPTDASGAAHACHQTMGIGTGACPPKATLYVNGGPGLYATHVVAGGASNVLKLTDGGASCDFIGDDDYFNMRGLTGKGLAFGGDINAYGWKPTHKAHMIIDPSGNVGIGTNVPGELLDVSGNIMVRGGNIYLSGTINTAISSSATHLQFDTSGNSRMHIDNSGNVGIGTGTATAQGILDISGGKVIIHGTGAGLDMSCKNISNVQTISFCDDAGLDMFCNDISNVKIIYFCDGGGLDMSCNDISGVDTIYFCDDSFISSGASLDISSTAIHFNISNRLHALDISSNGCVGIGTGDPKAKLDVDGTGRFRGEFSSYETGLLLAKGAVFFKTDGASPSLNWAIQTNLGVGTSGYGNFTIGRGNASDANLPGIADAKFIILGSDGKVGIGTNEPGSMLDVSGEDIRFRNEKYPERNGRIFLGDTNKISINNNNNSLILSTGQQERMRISSIGRVGIGTGDLGADVALDVSGNVNIKSDLYFNNITSASITGSGTDLQFKTGDSLKMYIDNSGNVGIGTDSPSQLLDVSGNVNIKDKLYFGGLTSTSILGLGTDLQFNTNLLSRLYITNDGYVGIGTNDPSGTLHVSSSGISQAGYGTIIRKRRSHDTNPIC